MVEERNCKDDGLIQRLLCNAPMPLFLSMEKIKIAREITLTYSVTVLLYIIQRYHKRSSKVNNTDELVEVNVVYKFDDEAEIELIKYYSQCRSISQKYNNVDSFLVYDFQFKVISYINLTNKFYLSTVFGKTITQIIRLCGVLQSLETCFQILLSLKSINKIIINVELEKEIDEIMSNLPLFNKITLATFNNTKLLMAYYNNNRILMAGYKLNLISPKNEINLESFLNSTSNANIIIKYSSDLKAIMEFKGNSINLSIYSQAKRMPSKYIYELFENLKDNNLGRIKTIKNKKGPNTIYFEKLDFDILYNNAHLNIFNLLNIDLAVLKNSYKLSNVVKHGNVV